MSDKDKAPHPPKPALAARVDELRATLKQIPASLLAERTGSNYQVIGPGRGEFRLMLVDLPLVVTYPEFQVFDVQENELPSFHHAMVFYYFDSDNAVPVTGKWISFADLPDGRVYDSAFQGNTGNMLVKIFGLDIESLRKACESLDGVALSGFGDAAYVIQALPRIPILVNYWCGDEDFPSTCKFLFDESVSHYLPIEACAILGGVVGSKVGENRGVVK
jgi:hypothetical protein